jgi:hypothetical protein
MAYITIRKALTSLVATVVLSVTLTTTSQAEDIPLVDGKLWQQSSADEKHSYLIGISNFLAIEYAYQKASQQPPTDDQSIIRQFYEDIDDISLDQITARIDAWYKNHPDRLDSAVINTIWVDMVEKQ